MLYGKYRDEFITEFIDAVIAFLAAEKKYLVRRRVRYAVNRLRGEDEKAATRLLAEYRIET